MVYFEDFGTTLDVSFDEIGAFMEFDEHLNFHAEDVRNFSVVETAGPTVVIAYERRIDGVWKKSGTRMVSFPPYCSFIEEIEGDLAGSRWVLLHRPDGAKTRVEAFGDIQCKGKSPDQTRKFWQATMEKVHNEDLAALRKFRDRR
jgi:hypothetical protein